MTPTDALLLAELALLALLYLLGAARGRRELRRHDSRPTARTLAFIAGLATVGIALVALDGAADSSLTAHMIQHVLLLFVAPPLLIAGAPHRVAVAAVPALRRPLAAALRSPAVRALTHPAAALAVLALAIVGWHLPGAYDATATSPILHGLEHAAFLLAGLLLWMPLFAAAPRPRTLSPLAGVLYLLLAMIPGSLVGIRLMGATQPLYAAYPSGQHGAGMVMVAGGSLLLALAAVTVAWRALEREERRQRRREQRLAAGNGGGSRAAGRIARTTLMLLCAAGAIALAAAGADRSQAQPEASPPSGPSAEAQRGRDLFVQGCSDCHGLDARGIEGRAPSLYGTGEGPADFYLRTGRMPLANPNDEPKRAESPYTPAEIDALVAYVGSLGAGPPIPTVDPQRGSLAEGQRLFEELCAGCHQIVARGGIVTGAQVPDLGAAKPIDVAEAVETGPYVMPQFKRLDSEQVDSLARYVSYTQDPVNRGGWGIGNIGPIPEGMVAWLLAGAALLLAIRLIGERTTR